MKENINSSKRKTEQGMGRTSITLSISERDKKKVKVYAAAHNTTMSELLHEWIVKNCIDD